VKLALLMFTATLGLSACGSPAADDMAPHDILVRATDATDKLNSAHFSLQQPNASLHLTSGIQISDAEGDIQAPDRLQMKFTILLGGGLSAEEHLIALGDERFLTIPRTEQWLVSASSTAAPHFLDRNRGVASLLRSIGDPRRLTNDVLDSIRTLHIKGTLRASAFAEMMDSQSTTDVVNGELWIGADDFLLRQLMLEGPLDAGDTDSTVRVLEFSNFDTPVAIARPAT